MAKRLSLVYLSILFALVLAIAPMPEFLSPYRPDWALLCVIYWCIALPHRVNVGTAWFVGLLLDLLLGSTLGSHGIVMAIVGYIASANFLRIRNFSVWQQAIIIALLSAFYHLADYWVSHFLTDSFFRPSMLWPVLTTTIMWPWAFFLLRKLRRAFKIV